MKTTPVVKASERYLNNIVPEGKHMRAESNTIILVRMKQDLDKWVLPHKPLN